MVNIMDATETIKREPGESVEHFMAKIHYHQNTVFKAGDLRLNFDANRDGTLTKEEAAEALASPEAQAMRPQQREAMQKVIDKATGPLDTLQRHMEIMSKTQVIVMPDGSKKEAIKGNIPDNELTLLDVDKNGKVSVGEYQHHMLQQMIKNKPPQEGPAK